MLVLRRLCPMLESSLCTHDGKPVELTVERASGRAYTLIRDPEPGKPSARSLNVKESPWNTDARKFIPRLQKDIPRIVALVRMEEELVA
jgi:hypothetical protein